MGTWWLVDEDHDREMASNRVSRYGAYLLDKRDRLGSFYDREPGRADIEWVWWCWEVATGPVMAPGYASWRAPVAGTGLSRDDFDGALVATVTVDVPVRLRGWHAGDSGVDGPSGWPRATGEVQLAARLDMPAVQRPGQVLGGPLGRAAADQLTAEAKATVREVVAALERHFGSAIEALAGTAFTAARP